MSPWWHVVEDDLSATVNGVSISSCLVLVLFSYGLCYLDDTLSVGRGVCKSVLVLQLYGK